MRSRAVGLTPSGLANAWLTVAMDTPASAAVSLIWTAPGRARDATRRRRRCAGLLSGARMIPWVFTKQGLARKSIELGVRIEEAEAWRAQSASS